MILPVIMAGGAGTRLWPLSSDWLPKQFARLLGDTSSFQQTLARVAGTSLFATPVVITAQAHAALARDQSGRAPTLILEPLRRDSCAAIALAACHAASLDPEQLVLALAADHQITDDQSFRESVRQAIPQAGAGAIVVFGVAPTHPATTYGYVRHGGAFVEKPNAGMARRLIAEGYLWNSGNFLFRADAMLAELERHAPDVLHAARAALAGASVTEQGLLLEAASFAKAPRASIDHAVMEKAQNIAVVEAGFDWSDIGSFDAVWQALPHDHGGNAIVGNGHAVAASNNLIHAGDLQVIVAGAENLSVTVNNGTVLITPRVNPPDMRQIAGRFAPLIKPTGFREYDARWWYGAPGPELNLAGAEALGLGLGTLLSRRGQHDIVTGHDFRSYSEEIKQALTRGLVAAGMSVHDIGLAVTPMAYFAQFELAISAVAMVTASHNENGWTGVKMGAARPLTFGPDDMAQLQAIVLGGDFDRHSGGRLRAAPGMRERYIAGLTCRPPFKRKFRVVVATGNGTAGAFAPEVLSRLGVEVIPRHTELDHTFPHYNPNPEDLKMLHDIAAAVKLHSADIGLGFDGDGDRCGVIDHRGREIFADKIGLLLARDLSARHKDARFVVDVKSTCLYETDETLRANGAYTDYFKTGHSHIKARVQELGALAGFEKSGHFFFNGPIGRGYDDGLLTAIAILDMLDRNPGKSLADLYDELPRTWGSPTMSAPCADEEKHAVVARLIDRLQPLDVFAGQNVKSLNLVNGARLTLADGTWGLVRASSNKPELVVVIESPASEQNQRRMFAELDAHLRQCGEVGPYNQTF